MKFELVKTQENSDATSNYNIIMPNDTTVEDFCNTVLGRSVQMQEHGSVYISTKEDLWHAVICKYYFSVMEFNTDYQNYKDKIIKSAWANGGYGAMSYWLTLV